MNKIIVIILCVVLITICAACVVLLKYSNTIDNNPELNYSGDLEEHIEHQTEEEPDFSGDLIRVFCDNVELSTEEENKIDNNHSFSVMYLISKQRVDEIQYWFDGEAPQNLNSYGYISGLNYSDRFNQLNIRIKYDNKKEAIYSYKLDNSTYSIGMLEEVNTKNNKTYFTVNGKEYYISIFPNHTSGEIVFLTTAGGNGGYVAPYALKPADIDSQRRVVAVDTTGFDVKNSRGQIERINYENVYNEFSYICYAEYDENKEFVKFEKSRTSHNETFNVAVDDIILIEKANVGCLSILRKYDASKEGNKFFRQSENSMNITAYIFGLLNRKEKKTIYLDRYLKDTETFRVTLKYQDQKIEFYKGKLKTKSFEFKCDELFDKAAHLVNDLDGKQIEIIVEVLDGDNIVVSKSYSPFLFYEGKMEIICDLSYGLTNNEDIILDFGRDLREYESANLRLYLFTTDQWSDSISMGSWDCGPAKSSSLNSRIFSETEDGKVRIDVKELKSDIRAKYMQNGYTVTATGGREYLSKDGQELNMDNTHIKLYVDVSAIDLNNIGSMRAGYFVYQTDFDGYVLTDDLLNNN